MAAPSADPAVAVRLQELAAIHESLRALTSTLELPQILHAVLGQIKTFTSAEGLSLLLYDRERDELVFAATETLRENALVGSPGDGPERAATRALRTGERIVCDEGRVLAAPIRRSASVIGAF